MLLSFYYNKQYINYNNNKCFMFFKIEFIAMAPEIFLVLVIHFLLIYGVFYSTAAYFNYPILLNNFTWLSIQTLFFTSLLVFFNPVCYILCCYNLLLLDEFGAFIKFLILIIALCAFLISIKYNQLERLNVFESIILILLAITGVLLLVSSFNFIAIYLALELQSFCLYILAALNRTSEFSVEAGLKYFILGAFSSGLFLFGLSLVYGFTGINNLGDLFQLLSVSSYNLYLIKSVNLASIFLLIGLFFKLSIVPFHVWSPDTFEGAPTSITTIFALIPKIGVLAVLTRFTYLGFYDLFFSWQELFLISSIGSILIGTFGALVQVKLKRLLAYGAIGHIGYLLIGFCCGSFEGLQATFIYIFLYLIMSTVCFAILLGIYKKKIFVRLNYLKDLSVLTKANPFIGFTFVFTFFSMAGIPPFAGFFSKMFLFIAATNSFMYSLAIIAILTSVISCFYYIRVIKFVFFDKTYTWLTLNRFDREKAFIISWLTLLLLFVGIYPMPFFYVIQNVLFFVVRNQFNFIYY